MKLNEGNRTIISKHDLKWNACMMVRNEEKMIVDAVSCIRGQTVPPQRIHVLNDGSTDSTGKILDSMDDVIVTNHPPHPPEQSNPKHTAKRHKLMYAAVKGADYILCMDADVRIPPNYMERITERMRLDNVALAVGTYPAEPRSWPVEPGLVIDAKWLEAHPELPKYAITHLVVEAALDGCPSVVYRNVQLRFERPMGVGYGSDVWRFRGQHQRMVGLSFWWVFGMFLRNRKLSFLRGYVSYRGEVLPKNHGQYLSAHYTARIKKKIGLKQQYLLDTKVGMFILPAKPESASFSYTLFKSQGS